MVAQPLEEAPLLHKVQDRSPSKFAVADPARMMWRQPLWGPRSASMRREVQSEDGTGANMFRECFDKSNELERDIENGGGEDDSPRTFRSSNKNLDPDTSGDLETVSTTTGQLSRATCDPMDNHYARAMPTQRQARRYYPLLMPFCLVQLFAFCAPALWVYHQLCTQSGDRIWRSLISAIPEPLAVGAWACGCAWVVINYAVHYYRLRGTHEIPEEPCSEPLTHVVIVCSYKEPTEVLTRTFRSIVAQKGIRKPPIAVFAAEARDPSWRESFAAVERICNGHLGGIMATEHVLQEGEAAGKAANENWAAREVYRKLVEEQGLDSFEVMLTIVDADSVMSPTYLAHAEAAFREQPDGRRLVYNGPLNVYRNFAQAGALVQSLELVRCHQDAFHNVFVVPYPFSNYSLTLGFASEIGFWTPDVMPEDIHTVNKAMVNSFGSRTTVTIPAIICNDLVPGIADRYAQAKRHQWGSVTELAWMVSLFQDMGLRFPAWWQVFTSEATRAGSFISTVACAAGSFVEIGIFLLLAMHSVSMPAKARFLLTLAASYVGWTWLWFWIAEFTYWQTLMRQFPVERPSWARWLMLVLLVPVLSSLNRIVFLIVPTAHALYHATFKGELAYVCAPKGDKVQF